MPRLWWSSGVVASLLAPPAAMAQHANVARFTAAPEIDGRLDDAVWATATRVEGFVQVAPGDNTPPSRATTVLLGADDHALYLAIRATDDPTLVRAHVAPRDAIADDDRVEFTFDTFGDRRRAFVIGFNPLGIQEDGVYAEENHASDLNLDLLMRSKGRVTAEGWVVEAAIPFSSLRYATTGGAAWTMHIRRTIPHLNNEIDSWMPIRRGDAGFLAQGGTLDGVTPPAAGHRLDLLPSVTTIRNDAREAGSAPGSERFLDGTPATELGGTLVFGVTPDITLDATWHPDFAQVEADAPVVTANQRFPIYYAEKRPFFLEGTEMLATPLQVVHTRAIVDPRAALKLTGKRGGTSFALLGAQDDAPGRADGSGDRSTSGILRAKRDLGAGSMLGLLFTGRSYPDRENATFGLDGALVSGHTVVIGQLTGSWAHRGFYDPSVDSTSIRDGGGVGYSIQVRRTGRHFSTTLKGSGRSRDYVADLGYTAQVNTNVWSSDSRWETDRRATGLVRSATYIFTMLGQVDWEGRTQYAYLWPHAEFSLPHLTTVAMGPYLDHGRLYEDEFGARRTATQTGAFSGPASRRTTWHGAAINIVTAPSATWGMDLTLDRAWDQFDYDFGDGPRFPRVSPAALADPNAPLDPGPGTTFDANADLTWRPGPALRISGGYTKSQLTRNDTHRKAYDQDIYTTTALYQFSRAAWVRIRGDYRAAARNLRPQFLLGWTPSPGTSVFVGYNDDLNRDGYSPVTGAYQRGVWRNSRTGYVKVSYLLRTML